MPNATLKWLAGKQFVGIDSSRHAVVLSTADAENSIGCKPSDLLLLALASCTAVDVVDILAKKRLVLTALTIEATGEQDPTPPWTFRHIHLHFLLRGPKLTPKAVAQAIELSESKYCSVAATVRGVAEITWDYVIEAD